MPGGSIGRMLAATAIAVLAALGAGPSAATHSAPPAVYADAIGDVGDAPDIAQITIRPIGGGLAVDVQLARPMQLGAYGWILFGIDTDRNAYTGGGRGDELLVLANGEGTTFARWTGSGFTSRFRHHDLGAALSATDLTFVLNLADTGTPSFEFSVASLREDADLAPGRGVATYPLPARRSRRARRHPNLIRSGAAAGRGASPAVSQDGLGSLEPHGAIAAEVDRRLSKVDQMRVDIQRELGGAEVQHQLSGHLVLTGRSALGKRLHRGLDAPQALDVGERQGDGAPLGRVQLARRRSLWRAGRRDRGRMSVPVAAAGRNQPKCSDGERDSVSHTCQLRIRAPAASAPRATTALLTSRIVFSPLTKLTVAG